LNIGSPLTTGLGKQDLTYVNATQPGVGSGLSNTPDIAKYSIANPTTSDFKQYNGRIDANVTGKDHVSFAIYWVPTSITKLNGGLGYQLFTHSQVNDAFDHLELHLSPSFLNEARANAAAGAMTSLRGTPGPSDCPQINLANPAGTQIGSITSVPRCACACPSEPMTTATRT
jgi:hypothetical protein